MQASLPITIFRWIAVLPASVAGSAIIPVVAIFLRVNIVNLASGGPPSGWRGTVLEWIDLWFVNFLAGALFVLIGYFVAPTFKRTVAAIFCFFSICFAALTLSMWGEVQASTYFELTAIVVGSVGALGFGFVWRGTELSRNPETPLETASEQTAVSRKGQDEGIERVSPSDNEEIICECPNCGSRVHLPQKHLGKRGRCSHCEEIFEATLPE